MKSNSQVDKHPDLARIRVFQEFFTRKGIRHLANITPGSIDEFRVTVLKGKKPKTVKNYITLLKTALNKAVEWDIIEHNPIAKVKSPNIVKTFHFFDRDIFRKLIAEADGPLRTGIILLAHTGMRRAELFNLRWRDVDLSAKTLRVRPYNGFSAGGRRPRAVPLSGEESKILRALDRDRGESISFPPIILHPLV
jgi:integrase